MSRSLSTAALASQNAEQTDEVWLILITLDHITLSEPIRVVNNSANITSNGHLFVAWAQLGIELPGEDADNPTGAKLRIGNIDPLIIQTIRSIDSPPTCTIQVILADNPDLLEIEFTGLVLRNAQYDAMQISGDLNFEEILTEPVATTLTPGKFPGLF